MKTASTSILTTLVLLGLGLTAGCAGNSSGQQGMQAAPSTTQQVPAPASQPAATPTTQSAPAPATSQVPPRL
ncbi:MAG: hypothetical protein ACRERZ_04675 [Gammaproteobacteria bacterium]